MLRLFIKGHSTEVLRLLAHKGWDARIESYDREFNETRAIVSEELLPEVQAWFNDHKEVIKGFGYPVGSLLHYLSIDMDETNLLMFVPGTLNSRVDRRFAQSAPCYMGITQRILQGFKGTHPNA